MLYVAIVEDDKKDAEQINEYAQTYAVANDLEVSVNSFSYQV